MQLFAAIHEDDIAVIFTRKAKRTSHFLAVMFGYDPKRSAKKEFRRALTYRGLPSH